MLFFSIRTHLVQSERTFKERVSEQGEQAAAGTISLQVQASRPGGGGWRGMEGGGGKQ